MQLISRGIESHPAYSHVLVVERDMIVGLGLAEDLLDLGYRVSGPFISCADILSLLDSDPPDRAIVDIALRDGTGVAAARALVSRRIPTVLFSAGDRRLHEAGEFRSLPWIDKPADTHRILHLFPRPVDRAA